MFKKKKTKGKHWCLCGKTASSYTTLELIGNGVVCTLQTARKIIIAKPGADKGAAVVWRVRVANCALFSRFPWVNYYCELACDPALVFSPSSEDFSLQDLVVPTQLGFWIASA